MSTYKDILTLAATFVGGGVFLYVVQLVIAYINRPKLELVIRGNAGLLVRTPGAWIVPGRAPIPDEFVYIRALVRNMGRSTAKQCIAYVSRIIWTSPYGHENTFADADMIEMKWAFRGHEPADIPRDAHQYVDLFRIPRSNLESSFPSDRFPSYLQEWGRGGGQPTSSLKYVATMQEVPPATFNLCGMGLGTEFQ